MSVGCSSSFALVIRQKLLYNVDSIIPVRSGVKILYDCFFKEVFNPEYAPERLEDLLEHILKQKVKIIVFFEKSEEVFHQFPENYLHFFMQRSDTGLEMNLLQKYYFIPLDIFRKNIHNKGIRTKLDAWLVFLTSDEPERIAELIEAYPEFKRLYEDIYELCRNVEDVMGLFSKELLELDRNTVQYMIDEMQDEIDASKKTIAEKEQQITEQGQQITEQEQQLAEQSRLLRQQELENQLYGLLSQDGRLADLGRAVTDAAFRKKLLEEYKLDK